MLSDFCINKLIKYNVIQEREKELYIYGIHQSLIIIQNVLITAWGDDGGECSFFSVLQV